MIINNPYKTFASQSSHYFNRDHQEVPKLAVNSPAAWRGPELLANPDTWQYHLSMAEINELGSAVNHVKAAGLSLAEVDRSNFPLPNLQHTIRQWRTNISTGIGVQVVKGLPVQAWSHEDSALAYWGLGHHLGLPGAQNPDNELLGHVKNYGETQDDPFVRLYRTTSEIRYHCDAADIVGLLCLQTAKSGGASRIVSTVTLFNQLLEFHPDLVPRLFEPFKLDRRDAVKQGQKPYGLIVPCCFAEDQLRTFYHSDYFHSVERHANVALSKNEKSILEFYDVLGLDDRFYLEMELKSGDIQFISNHTIAHARTEYKDFEEPEKKRHLLRLWLSAE